MAKPPWAMTPTNMSAGGGGAALSPDGGMVQQYALQRLQRQSKRVGQQTPGRVTPPPKQLPLKKY